ncbi:MAG: hypothetical protein AAGD25_17560 [Cyanobacteria bacterium P01_F01_bin.150]
MTERFHLWVEQAMRSLRQQRTQSSDMVSGLSRTLLHTPGIWSLETTQPSRT